MNKIQIKRIYDEKSDSDGFRVLVDRLWPRGITKEKAALDEWAREIAPSPELRKWFGHKEELFADFSKKYVDELNQNQFAAAFLNLCKEKLKSQNVTLLYAAKNPECNHALVLKNWLCEKLALSDSEKK